MRKVSLLFVFLLLPVLLLAKTTTLYHTSDVHGFFYARNGQGGFAALAAVLKKGPQPYLLLDSGDFSNGTVETRNSKGLKAVELMNKIGYNTATIGNHEFDFKNANFPAILAKADFPFVAANFFEKDTMQYPPHVYPYRLFTVGDTRVAVIGLANRTPTSPATDYTYTAPLKALEKALNEVEEKHPQIVAVLVHDSTADERHGESPYVLDIAEKFAGRVHVVMGGHAHIIVQNRVVNGVLFVESGCYLQNVSKITVETDDTTGKVVSAVSELIPLVVAQTGEDASMKAFADSLREPGVDESVGFSREVFSRKPKEKQQDSPLNDWIVDLVRQYAGTPIAIHNNGGTRVDLPKGEITRRDLIEVHPFDNTITKVTVSGKFLKKFIKTGFSPRSLFTYSGLDITYKVNKKGKIKSIKILFNGKPLENRKQYTVATNSYIAGGGSEGYLFKKIADENKQLVGSKSIRDLMTDAFANGPISAPETGRITER
jgi:2',3'-cyclic-nucleotide 2'-phosphodiesterase (5'-nucleotidase family)